MTSFIGLNNFIRKLSWETINSPRLIQVDCMVNCLCFYWLFTVSTVFLVFNQFLFYCAGLDYFLMQWFSKPVFLHTTSQQISIVDSFAKYLKVIPVPLTKFQVVTKAWQLFTRQGQWSHAGFFGGRNLDQINLGFPCPEEAWPDVPREPATKHNRIVQTTMFWTGYLEE